MRHIRINPTGIDEVHVTISEGDQRGDRMMGAGDLDILG